MNHSITPSIYVACLASYNDGVLHGEWIDVIDESYVNEAIQTMLDNSPIEEAEEFAIHDYEGFGSFEVHEYESIDDVCELADLMGEHGEIITSLYSYHGDIETAKETLENHYYGEHRSEKDFAIDLFDDLYAHEVPEPIQSYIDYDSFCRDVFINDFYSVESDSGVHVFACH